MPPIFGRKNRKRTSVHEDERETMESILPRLTNADLTVRLTAAHDLAKALASAAPTEAIASAITRFGVLPTLLHFHEGDAPPNRTLLVREMQMACLANLTYLCPEAATGDSELCGMLATKVANVLRARLDASPGSPGSSSPSSLQLQDYALCCAYNLRKEASILEALDAGGCEAVLRGVCEKGSALENTLNVKRARATLRSLLERKRVKPAPPRRGSSVSRAVSALSRRVSRAVSRQASWIRQDDAAACIQAAFRAIRCRRELKQRAKLKPPFPAENKKPRYDNFRVKDFRAELGARPLAPLAPLVPPMRHGVGMLTRGMDAGEKHRSRLAPLAVQPALDPLVGALLPVTIDRWQVLPPVHAV